MFEEAISLLSIWASMNTWLTPTVLFLLLNLMIGTIAVTSGFTSHKSPPSHHHHQDIHPQPQTQTQLTRSPSVLQRLKSLNFYSYIHTPQQSPLQIHHHHPPPPEAKEEVIPASDPQPPLPQVEEEADDAGPTLDEVYSRIVQMQSNPHYGRQNSDTKPSCGEIPVKLPAKMKKSASDKSAFNHFEAVEEGETTTEIQQMGVVEERENEVDARADDFINRFRQQLQMQRLESIVKYKEMITRSTAK